VPFSAGSRNCIGAAQSIHLLLTLSDCNFICVIPLILTRFFFAKSSLFPCVNLCLAVAKFETTCQLLTLASIHLHNSDHYAISHQVLVNVTHARELANVNVRRNCEIFISNKVFILDKL